MADLGHRERAEQLALLGGHKPLRVLVGVAEVKNRPAEEAELDAGLDLEARRGGHRLLEPGDSARMFVRPAEGGGKRGHGEFGGGHESDGGERRRPGRLEVVGRVEMGGLIEGELPAEVPGVGPVAVEDGLDGCRIEVEGEVVHADAPDLMGADEWMG
ncbi:Uncharacterised protein [Mycobacteroides abscessus subsp. abscessus]|nr:Uncharacterised protein [Mycobacteroides abscessus subsp. abscessus]